MIENLDKGWEREGTILRQKHITSRILWSNSFDFHGVSIMLTDSTRTELMIIWLVSHKLWQNLHLYSIADFKQLGSSWNRQGLADTIIITRIESIKQYIVCEPWETETKSLVSDGVLVSSVLYFILHKLCNNHKRKFWMSAGTISISSV